MQLGNGNLDANQHPVGVGVPIIKAFADAKQNLDIESIVIEKNKIIIFNGLTEESLVNSLNIKFIGAKLQISKIIAPINAINQYVDRVILPILILGKRSIDKVININVIEAIIIVCIINIVIMRLRLFYINKYLIK